MAFKRLLTIVSITVFCCSSQAAEYLFAPGIIGATGIESDEQANSYPILENETEIILHADFEITFFEYVGLNLGLGLGFGGGKTEYDNQGTAVSRLDTAYVSYNSQIGLRLSLLKYKNFRLFAGGGVSNNYLSIGYDKDDFVAKQFNTDGYTESDEVGTQGAYYEAGIEVYFGNKSGLRLVAQQLDIESGNIETLGNNDLRFDYTQFGILYVHKVDKGFFWK